MECRQHGPEQAEELFEEGRTLYGDFEIDKALEIFNHLLECHTDVVCDYNLHEHLGLCYYYKGLYNDGVAHLELAYTGAVADHIDELNILIINTYLAKCHSELKNYEKAMSYFRLADRKLNLYRKADRYNDLYLYRLQKGRCLIFMHQPKYALKEFEKSEKVVLRHKTEVDFESAKNILDYEFARAYYGMRRWKKVEKYLERVSLKILPETHHAIYWTIKIVAKTYLDKHAEAIEAFEIYRNRGISDTDGSLVHFCGGHSYFMEDRYSEAKENLQKALSYSEVLDWVKVRSEEYLAEISEEN